MEEENIVEQAEITQDIPLMDEQQFNEYMEALEKNHQESLEVQSEQHQELIDSLEITNETISSTNENIGSIPQVDNSELVAKMEELIETINSYSGVFEVIEMGSSSVITYAVYYVPLLIIVWVLWWFFKQFIR